MENGCDADHIGVWDNGYGRRVCLVGGIKVSWKWQAEWLTNPLKQTQYLRVLSQVSAMCV